MSTINQQQFQVNFQELYQHATGRQARHLAAATFALLVMPLIAIPLGISVAMPELSAGDSVAQQTISGSAIAVWVVLESLAILGLIKLYRWSSIGLIQAAFAFLVMLHLSVNLIAWHVTGVLNWFNLIFPYAAGVFLVCYACLHLVLEHRMQWWHVHNALAGGIAIFVSVIMGTALQPIILVSLLGVLLVWDIIAVKYTDIMADLVDGTSNIFIPNYVILGNRKHVDYWALLEYIKGERSSVPPSVDTVLGLGDIVFPAALVLSVTASGHATAGIAIAVGVAASFMLMTGYQAVLDRAMLPALPWAAVGAIPGLGVYFL